jgi:hypothetical protein
MANQPTGEDNLCTPPIFMAADRERLREFVTRDKRIRHLIWEGIIQEMEYACSSETLRNRIASIGYHKRLFRKN